MQAKERLEKLDNSSALTRGLIVIPTRNRWDLAINAIQSVLKQPDCDVRLLVSDNSTSSEDLLRLSDYCSRLGDNRLSYIRPPRPLPASQHWDWAMSQALQRCDAGYFIYLTDRSVFKPGALLNIIQLARRYPDRVVSYDFVTIFDHSRPIIVEPQPQTDQLLEISAARLLFLSSRSIFPRCLPRMMNCSVPRQVIERIQQRFGSVFASISPDYNFAYRCLELVDAILYYDHAAYISYALSRGNVAYGLGMSSESLKDFFALLELEGVRKCYAAPVPAFETPINYLMHEYCIVQRETTGDKFPKIPRIQYFARNVESWLMTFTYKLPWSVVRVLSSLRTRVRKILRLQWPTMPQYQWSPTFESIADAIDYASSVPPNGDESAPHLELLRGSAWS